MFEEFLKYYKKTFPFFTRKEKSNLRELVTQFEDRKDELYSFAKDRLLKQGDIIDKITFIKSIDDKKFMPKLLNGMLISNSCDIQYDKSILIAPVYSLDYINEVHDEGTISSIKKNMINQKFYLPHFKEYKGFIIDFSEIGTFKRKFIIDCYNNGIVKKIASLSLYGWYFLMMKLTLYLFRPETSDVIR